MLETLQNTKTNEKTRRRAMAVLCVVVGLALILVAAGMSWAAAKPVPFLTGNNPF